MRWTAKDPLRFAANVRNLFSYAFEDPVNNTDVSGFNSVSEVVTAFSVTIMVFKYLANPPEVPPRVVRRRPLRGALLKLVREKLKEGHKELSKLAAGFFPVPTCLWMKAAETLSDRAMSSALKGCVLDDECTPDPVTGALPDDCYYFDNVCPPPSVYYNWRP